MKQPLEDITVLDLSHALAGPYCSMTLGDFGAQVIKIEPPGGDIARNWGVPVSEQDSSYFVNVHRNKCGIVVDLKSNQGRELFLEMAEKADVVLENFRVGAVDKLGIGYEEVRKRNPAIIYCSVSGFGQDGPYRDRAALDLIVQAESGIISVTGSPGSVGVRCGVPIADLTVGMNAALGIMMALRVKERTGEGQFIDVSMMEGQMSLLGVALGNYLAGGPLPRPMGNTHWGLAPYQTFPTKTKDIALAVGSEKLWRELCSVIGPPEVAEDPRYRTNADRLQNSKTLIPLLEERLLRRSYEEWERLMIERGIPVGGINDLSQLATHPQVKARGTIIETTHRRAGRVKVVGTPIRLSRTPGSVRTDSPSLGEHTDEVMRTFMGMADERIAQLRRDRVLL